MPSLAASPLLTYMLPDELSVQVAAGVCALGPNKLGSVNASNKLKYHTVAVLTTSSTQQLATECGMMQKAKMRMFCTQCAAAGRV